MASTGAFPNGMIIGAQKAGTTYLNHLLAQYPDIGSSTPSEPHFFSKEFEKGWDWYKGLFPSDKAITFEKSTTYSFLRPATDHPGFVADDVGLTFPIPERLFEANPEMRLIYIMRDPVKRTVSAAQHLLRFNPDRSIDAAIREDPMLRLPSFYSAQISRYLEVFPRESFLFLSSKNLYADPLRVARECAVHFGTQHPDFAPQMAVTQNEKYQVHPVVNGILNALSFGRGAASINRLASRFGPLRQLRSTLKKQTTVEPPAPSDDTLKWLEEQFEGEIERVRDLVGVDLRG